jgi:hypothetical protein
MAIKNKCQEGGFALANILLNRFELSQYSVLRARVLELDESIREVVDELTELNKCLMNISPALTGMPKGNERIDKIAEFVIQLEIDRSRINAELSTHELEKEMVTYKLKKIRAAVNKIPEKQARDMVKWHFFDGLSISEIAEKEFMSYNAAYKRTNKYLYNGQ